MPLLFPKDNRTARISPQAVRFYRELKLAKLTSATESAACPRRLLLARGLDDTNARAAGKERNTMPLTMAKPGDTLTIRKITGKDEVRQHLAELGFVVGESITVVNVLGGNLILQVKESRIALDQTLARRILVA